MTNVTLTHDKSALGCSTLASNNNILNQGSPTWCPWAQGRPYEPCGSPRSYSNNSINMISVFTLINTFKFLAVAAGLLVDLDI